MNFMMDNILGDFQEDETKVRALRSNERKSVSGLLVIGCVTLPEC